LQQELVGVAKDFWKDGNGKASAPINNVDKQSPVNPAPPPPKVADPPRKTAKAKSGPWHAVPGEISEKMWGEGSVTPADEYITDLLIQPLSLTKDMSLLDLAAGLGMRMRRTTDKFGIYINGREPDPDVAQRGMALSVEAGLSKRDSITAYDPMSLVETRSYDCVIARETIYRVADKERFIKSIVACCKPKAQISFTDYIVNPESKTQPAIRAWRAFEKDAEPLGLVEMAELWAKAGISLRVHDDQTEYYKKEVKKGLLRLAQFMASGVRPDAETRNAIEKRITTWAHRVAAMEQGMRFYRFYGLR
jgi:cyclopropane fatty-acyl-phospholipid synthase-like methyltransferase